jgi:glycosyltransferase involved in cell wall biosynthesis
LRSRYDFAGLKRVFSFASPRPDVIVSRSVSAQVIAQLLAARLRVPHVTTEHTPCDENGRLLPFRRHRDLLLRLIAPRVSLAISVTRRQIPALVGFGFKRERIRVIPNGVAREFGIGARSRLEMRSSLRLDDTDFLALLIAKARPEKRISLFINAVRRAHLIDRRIRGFVVGDGPQLESIRHLAKATEGVVQALGGRRDVADLLNAGDVACLSSAYEALPMTVLEAMAVGRPVIATDVGGVRDLVVHGETGLVVPSGDEEAFATALVGLACDVNRTRAMGNAGRARQLERFTVDHMVDGYSDALRAVSATQRGNNPYSRGQPP